LPTWCPSLLQASVRCKGLALQPAAATETPRSFKLRLSPRAQARRGSRLVGIGVKQHGFMRVRKGLSVTLE
jgi:hypothetical protein